MDAVNAGGLFGFQSFGGGDIGQNHKFFNDFMGQMSRCSTNGNTGHFPFIIHDDFPFGNIKVDGSPV